MKDIFFSGWELQKIYELAKYDIDASYEQTLSYIEKYPHDMFGKIHLAQLMFNLNKPEFEEYLIYLEDYFYNYSKKDNPNRDFRTYVELIVLKINLHFLKGEYDEAYNLYLENKIECDKKDKFTGFSLIIKKKLGISDKYDKTLFDSYCFDQIKDYSETNFLEHIKKHQLRYNLNNPKYSLGLFNENFPTDNILEEIKKIVPCQERLLGINGVDLYCFKYDHCGRQKNSTTDYFCLITIHDTREFITMYPSTHCNKKHCIDLNYLNDIYTKDSTVNAIEKFSKRLTKTKAKQKGH